MDKLSEHAIRMLEIEGKGKNDGYIETRNMGDIARAVYDIILQVQMLKTELRHKDEPNCSEKPNNSTRSKMEQVDKDTNVRSKAVYDKWGNVFDARADIEDEPQTDCPWKKGEQP